MGEVYILKDNGDRWDWIDETLLEKYVQDGKVDEDDLIIYPKEVRVARLSVKLEVKPSPLVRPRVFEK